MSASDVHLRVIDHIIAECISARHLILQHTLGQCMYIHVYIFVRHALLRMCVRGRDACVRARYVCRALDGWQR